MKNTTLLLLCSLLVVCTQAQNVGIGITAPTEKLHVDSGNVKIGRNIWSSQKSHLLKFGDGDFCYVGEVGDDSLQLKARQFTFIDAYGQPNTRVQINGTLKVVDGSQGEGKVLTSDATGQASWQAPGAPFAIPFKGTNGPNQGVVSGFDYLVSFNTEEYDYGNAFSFSTFNAPATGVYHFDAGVYWSVTSRPSSFNLSIAFSKSGTLEHATNTPVPANTAGDYFLNISADIYMTAGQTLQLRAYQSSGVSQNIICNNGNGKFTFFNGRRVY